MHLSPYDTTHRFGRLARDIQGRRIDREDSQRQGGVATGSALVGYRGVGAHALPDQRGRRTLSVAVAESEAEAEAKRGSWCKL